MRVSALTAGLFITTALISVTGLAFTGSAAAHERRVSCLCDCPDDHKVSAKPRHAALVRTPRMTRRVVRPARSYSYRYASNGPVIHEWHGGWQVAPNDAMIGPMPGQCCAAPVAYGPPPIAYDPSIRIDDRGFNGGVGVEGGAGGGGGGGGDFGQVHFGNGGSVENGPTYNSYNQSFQYNPSVAGPFVPQRMGVAAPVSSK